MPPTLAQMRAIALDLADVTGDPHLDTSRVNDWFNLELAALNDLYVSAEENYRVTKATIPLIAGQRTYAVPTDLYRIAKLYLISTGSTARRPLHRMSLTDLDRDAYTSLGLATSVFGDGLRYSYIDRNLELSGSPPAGSLELWYVPAFAYLTTDSQTLDPGVPAGHEDWVILGVAIRARLKEESDTTQLETKRAEVRDRILSLMSQRDQGEAEQVTDFYGRRSSWWSRL